MAFCCLCVFSLLYMFFTNMTYRGISLYPMMPQINDNKGIPTCGNVNNYCEIVCSFCVICINDKVKQIYLNSQ